jgi:cytidylate kinase
LAGHRRARERRARDHAARIEAPTELVITIDGPAGAGKSSTARELAQRLGYRLVDTGALYRALAWAVTQAGVDAGDERALAAVLARTRVELAEGRVLVDGKDVTAEIRTPEITHLTSQLTTLGVVREKMTPLQRELAAPGGVVLEGRDTGTVVWPEAAVKFYLVADLETRAGRRRRDLLAQGVELDLATVTRDVAQRDQQDTERALAPLRQPAGAVVVDTSRLGLAEVVEQMLAVVDRARCCTGS